MVRRVPETRLIQNWLVAIRIVTYEIERFALVFDTLQKYSIDSPFIKTILNGKNKIRDIFILY